MRRATRLDGKGQETATPIDSHLDIGVFTKHPDKFKRGEDNVLYFQKHHVTGETSTVEIEVDGEPVFAGLDPYVKMVDRNPEDNVQKLDKQ